MKNYSVYRMNSPSFSGYVYLKYADRHLDQVQFVPFTSREVFDAILEEIPQNDPDIEEQVMITTQGVKIKISRLKSRTAKEKIVHFCHAYKVHRGTHYQPKEHEKSNIKAVPVNKELLDVFFASPIYNFTIDNYISRINITRDWVTNGMPSGNKMPDYYDPQYERSLSGDQLQVYHQHLVSKGWEKIYNPNRGTIWVEKRLV